MFITVTRMIFVALIVAGLMLCGLRALDLVQLGWLWCVSPIVAAVVSGFLLILFLAWAFAEGDHP